MTAIRQTVDANLLNQFINIPASFLNNQLEIIIMPPKQPQKPGSLEQLQNELPGSLTESLTGVISSDITLEYAQAERRSKI